MEAHKQGLKLAFSRPAKGKWIEKKPAKTILFYFITFSFILLEK